MTSGTEDISISKEPGRQRYELTLGGELAGFIAYRAQAGRLDLVHTEVLSRFEGRGLAGRLAQFAFEDARRQGVKVVPSCSYIAEYARRHPQVRDVVDAGAPP